MGNKYDLLEDLLIYFPDNIPVFVDLFGGSGVVSANINCNEIWYNEIDTNIFNIYMLLKNTAPQKIIEHIKQRQKKFDLTKESKENYNKFREFYNKSGQKTIDLFTLTFFSFSNLIRFNSKGEFNMPNGKRTYNELHNINIELFHNVINDKNIKTFNKNAFDLFEKISKVENVFVYLDPPYLNTTAIYNEKENTWGIQDDYRLFKELDALSQKGIRWAISNTLENRGKKNKHLEQWALKNNYEIIELTHKNYYSLGKGDAKTTEVLILNYKPRFKRYSIFDFMEEEGKK